jgi:hypothetical protein
MVAPVADRFSSVSAFDPLRTLTLTTHCRTHPGMTALKFARASLVVSIILYAAALGLGYAGLLPPEPGMLLSIVAMAGMVLSSIACLLVPLLEGRR